MSTPAPASAGSEQSDAFALAVERYLHRNIPLSAAMGVRVKIATPRRVELDAPLVPNVNHQSTVFGGSASALAMLSAWTLVHFGLRHESIEAATVIQRNAMAYEALMHGGFTAVCTLTDEAAWRRFVRTIERHGRGRITLRAHLLSDGRQAASFEGDFCRPAGRQGGLAKRNPPIGAADYRHRPTAYGPAFRSKLGSGFPGPVGLDCPSCAISSPTCRACWWATRTMRASPPA